MQIESTLDPLTTIATMPDIATFNALASGITHLIDLGNLLVRERDAVKLSAIQLNFTERLLNLQTQLVELVALSTEREKRIAELEEVIREVSAKKLEHERYALAHIAPGRGLAYRLKAPPGLTERTDEPPHFLCQPRFDQGLKAVLVEGSLYGQRVFDCPLCKASLYASPAG